MKKTFFTLVALICAITLQAQVNFTPMRNNARVLSYRAPQVPLDTTNLDARFSSFAPSYLIFPNQAVDAAGATQLIRELGIDRQDFVVGISVFNPGAKGYDAKVDVDAYKALIDEMRVISNLKVIGIGNGATFVNQNIAPIAGEIAGIVSIDGKAGKVQKDGGVPVPAFIVGKGAANVAKPYIAANKATRTGKDAHMQIYTNAAEPLQRVVISEANGQTLAEIFNDAWKELLNKNYRFNNMYHTFYEGQKFGENGLYELEPWMNLEEWGVKRNCVVQPIQSYLPTKYLWFEYIPDGMSVQPKSVPLVLLLHGNGNDPRTQAETSGWIELAAKEKFFVAELEWQGKPNFDAMGHDGIETTVELLLRKYPQLDPARVYTEGLSAGSMTSSAIGVKKSHIFAAVGAMSGGLFAGSANPFGSDGVMSEAIQKSGAVEVAYVSVSGTDDMVIRYPRPDTWKGNGITNAWKIYEIMNGMNVVEEYDFAADPAFGQPNIERQVIETNKGITVQVGTLRKGNVPLMKLVAVMNYGHWNFYPAAQMMWDHFKHFSRDLQTKKLIYTP